MNLSDQKKIESPICRIIIPLLKRAGRT